MNQSEPINIASDLHKAGRLPEADAAYRAIIKAQPLQGAAFHGLGVLSLQRGNWQIALDLLRKAVVLQPDAAEYWNNLGLAYRTGGLTADSVAAHRRATELSPINASAHSNLGLSLRDMGCLEEAEAALRRAIALSPEQAYLYNNLGTVLMRAAKFDDAAEMLHLALKIQPNYLRAYNNLGTNELWRGRPDASLPFYKKALELRPDYAEVHWHRATALLMSGNYRAGWGEYEWRWGCAEYRTHQYILSRQLWDGTDPSGKTILITPEQGLGDTFQFARYGKLLSDRGARVLLLCQPELTGVLRHLAGVAEIIPAEKAHSAHPQPLSNPILPPKLANLPFDYHIPLLSLPHRFGTTLQTIPAAAAYLHADRALSDMWRSRLADGGDGAIDKPLRIGLCWAGRQIPDPHRTCGLSALLPALELGGVQFVSLQVGPAAAEVRQVGAAGKIRDFSADLTDFTQTAALMSNLDLVITIDTAVAHLAGALGVATWTLLRYGADWRWLLERNDTPWYPNMRLFRQSRLGDWAGVVKQVVIELIRLAGESRIA